MILFLNLIYFHSFLNHSLIISMYTLTYFSSCFPHKIVLSSLHIKFHVLFLSQKNNKGAVSTLGSTESLTLLKRFKSAGQKIWAQETWSQSSCTIWLHEWDTEAIPQPTNTWNRWDYFPWGYKSRFAPACYQLQHKRACHAPFMNSTTEPILLA